MAETSQYTVSIKVVGEEALRKLQSQLGKVATQTKVLGNQQTALKATGGAFKNMGNQVQNASYQLTDFIVQVQGGTSASRAFSQQAPQLLGAFGALGAALGIVAAVAPAVFQLFTGSSKSVKEAATSVSDFADATRRVNTGIDDLSSSYGQYAAKIRPVLELQRQLAEITAIQDMNAAMKELNLSVGAFEGGIGKFVGNVTKLQQFAYVIGLLPDEASKLEAELDKLKKAKGFAAQADQAQVLIDYLRRVAPLSEESTQSLKDLYAGLNQVAEAAILGAAATERSADAQRDLTAAAQAQIATNTDLKTQVLILEGQAKALENGATAANAAADAMRRLALAQATAKAIEDGVMDESESQALKEYEKLLYRQANAQERIAVATKAQTDATKASAKGMSEAQKAMEKAAREAKRLQEQMEAAAKSIDDQFSRSIEDGIINAASGAKGAFSDMAKSILEDIARMYLRAKVLGPLMQALGLGGSFTSAGLSASSSGNYFPNGITGRPLTAFATGGIIGGRTRIGSNLLGESGAEAVMPLKRSNGRMGVAAAPVNVNVINNAGSEVSVSETTGNDGSRTIDVMIESKMRNSFATGAMDKVMKSRFGTSPVGG